MIGILSRREFVTRLVVVGSTLASTRAFADNNTVINAPWVQVRHANKFKPGVMEHIVLPESANEEEIYVTVDLGGNFSALWSRCTHQGCIVGWKQASKQFVCPCHGGHFDAHGMVVSGPPQKPLRALSTKVDNQGMVLVQLPS